MTWTVGTPVTALALGIAIGACVSLCSCGGDSLNTPTSSETAPGTATRPILSAAEAQNYTMASYFAQSGTYAAPISAPWQPSALNTSTMQPDFVVASTAAFSTVQKAVNAAVERGGSKRLYIEVLPGTYSGVVYVPSGAPPITVYGGGSSPSDVVIADAIDAYWSLATYAQSINPSGQFVSTDPAWSMYSACASQPGASKIDTPCSAVFWSQSNDLQLVNLTITNTMPVTSSSHQAVALRTDGDRTQIDSLRLIGGQDTFFVNAGAPATPTNQIGAYQTTSISRAYVRNTYVQGDVDFVFGRANAVFDNCEFHSVSTRGTQTSYVFAPDTVPAYPYGFLVINSKLTGDAGFLGTGKANLGCSWDQGASSTGYVAAKSPNGQIVIRDTTIDSSFNVTVPWSSAATTGRAYQGNNQASRNLSDPTFNRLWEFNNFGAVTGQSS